MSKTPSQASRAPGAAQARTPHPLLVPPLPRLDRPFQPGVTDPVWPAVPQADAAPGFDPGVYDEHYAGQLDRQRHLHIVTADVTSVVRSRADLAMLLREATVVARHQMAKAPVTDGGRPYDAPVVSRRVTVTLGLGATLFTSRDGDDRFGLAALKPAWLKVMPSTEGDDNDRFSPREHATDLVVLIASDDFYVNEYIFGRFFYGGVHPGIKVCRVERGYARPDNREPSGFEDGLTNPRDKPPNLPERHSMHDLVYVRDGDGEPDWCTDGTYLAYRKVRRRLSAFFELKPAAQEKVFGVDRKTGNRPADAAPDAHSPKMNPRRPAPDLFGTLDDERRFLRRPYFFNDGLDDGDEVRGLQHLAFARRLGTQYEWPVHMWQMNRNFPKKGDGLDALYDRGGAANVGGGYYFIPRAAADDKDFIGSGLLT